MATASMSRETSLPGASVVSAEAEAPPITNQSAQALRHDESMEEAIPSLDENASRPTSRSMTAEAGPKNHTRSNRVAPDDKHDSSGSDDAQQRALAWRASTSSSLSSELDDSRNSKMTTNTVTTVAVQPIETTVLNLDDIDGGKENMLSPAEHELANISTVLHHRTYVPLDLATQRIAELQNHLTELRTAHLAMIDQVSSRQRTSQEAFEKQHRAHLERVQAHYQAKLELQQEMALNMRARMTERCQQLQQQLAVLQASGPGTTLVATTPTDLAAAASQQPAADIQLETQAGSGAVKPDVTAEHSDPALLVGTERSRGLTDPGSDVDADEERDINADDQADAVSLGANSEGGDSNDDHTAEDGEEDVDEDEDELADDLEMEGEDNAAAMAVHAEAVQKLEAEIARLTQEMAEHEATFDREQHRLRREMEMHEEQVRKAQEELAAVTAASAADKEVLQREVERKTRRMDELKQEVRQLEERLEQLEEERLANVEVDVANEIRDLRAKLAEEQKSRDQLRDQLQEVTAKEDSAAAELGVARNALEQQTVGLERLREEKEALQTKSSTLENDLTQDRQQLAEQTAALDALQRKVTSLQTEMQEQKRQAKKKLAAATSAGTGGAKSAALSSTKEKQYKEEIATLKTKLKESRSAGGSTGGGGASSMEMQRLEKKLKDAEKRVEMYKAERQKDGKSSAAMQEDIKAKDKQIMKLQAEVKQMQDDIDAAEKLASNSLEKLQELEVLKVEAHQLRTDNASLQEQVNEERKLRKQYYNKIEDMKGKIRVYCRVRPLSGSEKARDCVSVVHSPDEFTMEIRDGQKAEDFQFDAVFMPGTAQELVYEDTGNLIQSAVDGYNVCIFAYGQTGSGKTYTMIGDSGMTSPGLAPRAFEDIFDLVDANSAKFKFEVSCYMIELYCDRLRDLFGSPKQPAELKVKLDKQRMVYVEGSQVRQAATAQELYKLFEEGNRSRMVAKTNMNAESSRSHLVIGIIIRSTSLTDGKVTSGKLSLVDLAGSERAGKTGAEGQQIIEAKSINKSLSALGNVITALSTKAKHVPYRDNILTQLMQDSLGGNAKTLMFVNVSPADYNTEETLNSLRYAKRVKTITNDAKKNAESEEIARLKGIIAKLRNGEELDPEEDAI